MWTVKQVQFEQLTVYKAFCNTAGRIGSWFVPKKGGLVEEEGLKCVQECFVEAARVALKCWVRIELWF